MLQAASLGGLQAAAWEGRRPFRGARRAAGSPFAAAGRAPAPRCSRARPAAAARRPAARRLCAPCPCTWPSAPPAAPWRAPRPPRPAGSTPAGRLARSHGGAVHGLPAGRPAGQAAYVPACQTCLPADWQASHRQRASFRSRASGGKAVLKHRQNGGWTVRQVGAHWRSMDSRTSTRKHACDRSRYLLACDRRQRAALHVCQQTRVLSPQLARLLLELPVAHLRASHQTVEHEKAARGLRTTSLHMQWLVRHHGSGERQRSSAHAARQPRLTSAT